MEVFNFAYEEITGTSETKSSDECTQTKYPRSDTKGGSARNEARNYDRKLVQKITSILDQVEDSTREEKATIWRSHARWTEKKEREKRGRDPENTERTSEATEERALKRVRRKIKNKLSAQESRRKKKEYIVTMEKRVEMRDKENRLLNHKVVSLENTVKALLMELKRLSKKSLERKRKTRHVTMCSRGIQTGRCLKCLTMKNKGQLEKLHSPTSKYLARTPDNSCSSDRINSSSSSDKDKHVAYNEDSAVDNIEERDDEYLSDSISQSPEISFHVDATSR